MSATTTKGKISFIQHDKQYATIEYMQNGKKKTINGIVSEEEQQKLKEKKLIKKLHHFHIGDEVNFVIEQSPRGDKMIATNIQYITNNELANLLYKAKTDNKFAGYLKFADDRYFVKEAGSYFVFSLILSQWEYEPAADSLNEPVFFSLENIDNPEKVTARLFKSSYIPAFKTAQQYFKSQMGITVTVCKVTPHAIYINVIGEAIQGKLTISQFKEGKMPAVGDTIKVRISYLSPLKIAVELVS